ncbi:MAG TPA: TonB family protein [Thermoanaerobaculia bacterium]|nr:TonB family protein [Thermoanaerobaculia bacterium]
MAFDPEDDDLYLRPAEKPQVDEASWEGPGKPESRGPAFDPLDESVSGPARPSPEGKPFLLRTALSVAALIALIFIARQFWWPGPEAAPEKAPGWSAAPHVPDPVPPAPSPVIEEDEPEPEVAEEPSAVFEDDYEILPAEELAREPAIPRPVEPRSVEPRPRVEEQVAVAPPPAPEPVVAEKAREEPARPEPRPAEPARRAPSPAPWETAAGQPAGLLRPGPGVEEPIPLDLPRYRYPSAARGTGLEVGVRLALLVDERGRVINAVVREGGPEDLGFAEEALKVARQIPFQPASRYDIPGKMWTEMILEFAE